MDEAVEVKVARTHDDALLPTKGSIHAAGWDLYSLEDTIVRHRSSTMVRTGLHVAIPEGYEGQVRARSSLGKKGLIDLILLTIRSIASSQFDFCNLFSFFI